MPNKKIQLTPSQRLQVAREIVSSDISLDADCIVHGVTKAKTKLEKDLARMIVDLYVVIHPSGKCKHPEWDEKTLCQIKNTM